MYEVIENEPQLRLRKIESNRESCSNEKRHLQGNLGGLHMMYRTQVNLKVMMSEYKESTVWRRIPQDSNEKNAEELNKKGIVT